MKIVLKGIRGSGKTSLRRRLAGSAFRSAYVATSDTEMTAIEWSMQFDPHQVVEIQVWEIADAPNVIECGKNTLSKKVVDECLSAKVGAKASRLEPPLSVVSSASICHNAHGVMFMVDPSRLSSLKFVLDHCATLPSNLHVAVLINFFDEEWESAAGLRSIQDCEAPCGHDRRDVSQTRDCNQVPWRLLTHEEIEESVIIALPYESHRSCLRCVECSMANCFGLTVLYDYFAIPFLNKRLRSETAQAEETKAQLLSAT